MPPFSAGAASRMCASTGRPAGRRALAPRSTGSNSSVPPSGAPLSLTPADRLLLVVQRRAVPDLDQHPDAPRDQVGAAAQPARARRVAGTQTWSVERAVVLELDVVRAVLEAHQVARRRPARGSSTRCGRSRAATSASRRRRGRCARGCGRRGRRPAGRRRTPGRRGRRRSAPGRARRRRTPGRSTQRRRARRARGRSGPPRSNSVGPKPKVIVSRAGARPDRLAGVVRAARRVVVAGAGGLARRSSARPPAVQSRSRSRRSCCDRR